MILEHRVVSLYLFSKERGVGEEGRGGRGGGGGGGGRGADKEITAPSYDRVKL